MLTTILAYVLIGFFVIIQRVMRQGQQAKSLEPGDADRGSTRLLGTAFLLAILALIAAPVLNAFQAGEVSHVLIIGWIGIGIMLCGLALRLWANVVLGRYYTSTLRLTEGQRIVTGGPYRILRHPGYSGMLMTWVGAGLATANWIAATLIALVMLAAYYYRIQSEEAMLLTSFGEPYQAYAARTWRLLPFVY
jgi:protein-S-isoprenylcysteine O-methyltransferase